MLIVALLNLCFWVGAWLLMSRWFQNVLSRLLATIVVGFAIIVICLELLSLGDAIRIGPVTALCGFVFVIGIVVCTWPRRNRRDPSSCNVVGNPVEIAESPALVKHTSRLVVGFAIWAALDCLIYGLFTPVPVDSDAPIYHLPFAIHWAKVHTLDFVPTPFGEEGAPYFPANGDLWLTWLALTTRSAVVIKVGQWPFLVIGGLALYAIARKFKASPESAAIAAGIWCCLPLSLRQSSVANVDLIWTAFYFIALFFVMRYRDVTRCNVDARPELWMSGLSLGIVLGTKSVGLVYVLLMICPLACLIWINAGRVVPSPSIDFTAQVPNGLLAKGSWRRSLGLRVEGLVQLAAAMLLPSSFWYVRNMVMTGNPLYPLDVSWLNHRILSGWYDVAAMRETAYHIPVYDWPLLERRLVYAASPCLLSLWFVSVITGVIATLRSFGKSVNDEVRLMSVMALLQVGIYWFVVPYNTQERFLLPALGIGLIPLAKAVSRWPIVIWPIALLFLTHISLALFGNSAAMDNVSFRTLHTLLNTGTGWQAIAIVGSLVVAGTMVFERQWFGWIAASIAIIVGCVLYGTPLASFSGQYPERGFYPEIGFGARMFTAWQIVERESSPGGTRIAYAGGNLPYYLLGAHCRNDVFYVNINRHGNWLPHDYHNARRLAGKTETASIPWPQWYREEADYKAWLENVRSKRIELLFVSRTNLHGRLYARQDELPPFPIERMWADSHPEEFEDLGPQKPTQGSIPWARVYRLKDH